MIDILLKFHVYKKQPSGGIITKEDLITTEVSTVLTLTTLAPKLPKGAGKPGSESMGNWMSVSPYVGVSVMGTYYVRVVNFDDDEQWTIEGANDVRYLAPRTVGFFFDTAPGYDTPFLVLRGFEPLTIEMVNGFTGLGSFRRAPPEVDRSRGVEWYKGVPPPLRATPVEGRVNALQTPPPGQPKRPPM
jgi:hypothetical protein